MIPYFGVGSQGINILSERIIIGVSGRDGAIGQEEGILRFGGAGVRVGRGDFVVEPV